MMISNLPVDLLEDILLRVSVTSIGAVRSTCKNWNVLCRDQSFANKHIEKASERERVVLVITGEVNDPVIVVNPYDFHNKTFSPSVNREGFTRKISDLVGVLDRVFYCNGLLLRLWRRHGTKRSLLVCNPYWCKTRWINCPKERLYEVFAFGYDKSCGTHKILRLSKDYVGDRYMHIDIYDLSCDSWKTPDVAFHSNDVYYTNTSLSLKGNTYWLVWLARDRYHENGGFLRCFDFTRERFGPHLHLPFLVEDGCSVSLSSVKEEKLAAILKQKGRISEIEVWVTDEIAPRAVSWSKLFKVGVSQFLYYGCMFESFLIDEEKKTVVVFDVTNRCFAKSAYIIDGESGDVRQVGRIDCFYSKLYNLVGCYVPSTLQI